MKTGLLLFYLFAGIACCSMNSGDVSKHKNKKREKPHMAFKCCILSGSPWTIRAVLLFLL